MNLEIIKSYLVWSPLEGVARRLDRLIEAPTRRKHPELTDISPESELLETVIRGLLRESANCIQIALLCVWPICPNGCSRSHEI